ncbi:uncharacterized protein SETTUDRAFT_163677 [Exserohilum turcica Et28A]|uniref:Uncharacterized protein n=1 Tax=Exserohilum turcicum (strain 28A) TaxID=671987 RepID=R0II51_EXST2|nr:uncharacterized protein SETTUDRAFT_163677 [Exserohilum turcica Et28A]EOA84865.1 hypothetical protein SETTUDRAFT_163677 [Exserohilum turcica Et28A]
MVKGMEGRRRACGTSKAHQAPPSCRPRPSPGAGASCCQPRRCARPLAAHANPTSAMPCSHSSYLAPPLNAHPDALQLLVDCSPTLPVW